MKSRIILIGSFHKARHLAESLLKKGYRVTAINDNYERCLSLSEIDGLTVINGDGTKPFVLEDARIQNADIAIALTRKDEDNLVICQLCKKKFNVKKTVALANDPNKIQFFHNVGIDSVVCAISAITSIIEQQAFLDEFATLVPIGEGRINIAEVLISESAPAVGKKLWELSLPKEVIIGCILRGEMSMVPRGDSVIESGDKLVLIATNKQEITAIKELTGR